MNEQLCLLNYKTVQSRKPSATICGLLKNFEIILWECYYTTEVNKNFYKNDMFFTDSLVMTAAVEAELAAILDVIDSTANNTKHL